MTNPAKKKAQEIDRMIMGAGQASAEGDQATPVTSEALIDAGQQPPPADVVPINNDDAQALSNAGEAETTVAISESEFAELKEQVRKADARWRSLQGQVDSKDRQIEQLHGLLANMQEAPPAESSAPEAPAGVTQADKDAYGEDMIDLIQRVSAQVTQDTAAKYQGRIDELEAQLQHVSTSTASTVKASFESQLDDLADGWRELNTDDDFIEWLGQSQTRQRLFQEGASSKNAEAVAEFFNMYAQLHGKPKGNSRQEQLERTVAPGKSRTTSPPAASPTPEEKVWSKSEIAAFYRSKSTMSAEDFLKTEKEISQAMQAGRVDYSK